MFEKFKIWMWNNVKKTLQQVKIRIRARRNISLYTQIHKGNSVINRWKYVFVIQIPEDETFKNSIEKNNKLALNLKVLPTLLFDAILEILFLFWMFKCNLFLVIDCSTNLECKRLVEKCYYKRYYALYHYQNIFQWISICSYLQKELRQ